MNLQELKDALHEAGWDNTNDAQGEKIKQLWINNFPKDYVINGLMVEIDRLSKSLDEIASIYENGRQESNERNMQAYDMRCVARKTLSS